MLVLQFGKFALDNNQILWLCFGLIAGLLAVTFVILRRTGVGLSLVDVAGDCSPLRLLTVASIVASVLVLGLAGRLDSQAIASILSGLAGYVLGGVSKPRKS